MLMKIKLNYVTWVTLDANIHVVIWSAMTSMLILSLTEDNAYNEDLNP